MGTGRALWFDTTGQAIGRGITPYASGGRQYIAVPAGLNSPIGPGHRRAVACTSMGCRDSQLTLERYTGVAGLRHTGDSPRVSRCHRCTFLSSSLRTAVALR